MVVWNADVHPFAHHVDHRHDHAVVLLEGSAASEECDGEDDESDGDEENGGYVQLAAEEGEVVLELDLEEGSGDDQLETGQAVDKVKCEEDIFDTRHSS